MASDPFSAPEDGQGLILRVIETEGLDTEAVLTLPAFAIAKAVRTSLVEEDQESLASSQHEIRLKLRPYGLATVRVVPAP